MMGMLPQPRRDITARISQEYQEMPGLQLTLAQAARLFDTDPHTVEAALDSTGWFVSPAPYRRVLRAGGSRTALRLMPPARRGAVAA